MDNIRYASFWQRVGAFAFDYIIISGYLLIVLGLGLTANVLSDSAIWLFSERIRAQISAFFLVTLPITLYFAICESSHQQATWGKRRLGLQITDSSGQRLSFGRSLTRTLLKFIPWELAHTLLWQITFYPEESRLSTGGYIVVYALVSANAASLLLTKTHQTLYDLVTRSIVTKSHEV